jgi:Circularly permutated YpsA SLOG family
VPAKVISAGRAGPDQAGWRAAHASSIPTGRWMPLVFLTEVGPRPEFAARYGAVEMPTPDGPPAPKRAFASLWFGDATAPGARTTRGRVRQAEPVVPSRRARGPDSTLARCRTGPRATGLEVEVSNRGAKFAPAD